MNSRTEDGEGYELVSGSLNEMMDIQYFCSECLLNGIWVYMYYQNNQWVHSKESKGGNQ